MDLMDKLYGASELLGNSYNQITRRTVSALGCDQQVEGTSLGSVDHNKCRGQ